MPRERRWAPGRPVDLGATLGPMRRGSGDPTFRYDGTGGGLWRGTRTPDGPATLRLAVRPADGEVVGTAWGAGRRLGRSTGCPRCSAPTTTPAASRRRIRCCATSGGPGRAGGCRRPAGCWRRWCPRCSSRRSPAGRPGGPGGGWSGSYGEPAPGPAGLVPDGLHGRAGRPDLGRASRPGTGTAPASTCRGRAPSVTAAGRAGRLEALVERPPAAAATALRTLPGIGVWTAAEVGAARPR